MQGDSVVADNTNVDVYMMRADGSNIQQLTTNPGADNTPRFSPDGQFSSYLSMERAGFEADRQRLMILRRNDGRPQVGNAIETTTDRYPPPRTSTTPRNYPAPIHRA